MCILALVSGVPGVSGHGSVSHPPPRQAIDGTLAPWNAAVLPKFPLPFDFPNWCGVPDAKSKDPRNITGSNGQACFWFNNGCDIGTDKCDGVSGQVIPCCSDRFVYNGTGNPPAYGGKGLVLKDEFKSFNRSAYRPKFVKYPARKATICDKRLRTLNTDAECGSKEDFWYNAPWRSPGMASVTDACGTAGGVLPGQKDGTAGADYMNTVNAKTGDLGSKVLKSRPSNTVWKAGDVVEVAWVQKAWHGGGDSYRLAPADGPLTEASFQKMPLDFVGNSSLRWGGVGGEQLFFNSTAKGWEVNVGTTPEGSMWRKCPLPRGPWNWRLNGASFEPVCQEDADCTDRSKSEEAPPCLGPDKEQGCACKCSGDGIGDLPQLEIVDKVRIPAGLKAGAYVLGWRWDCEESTQIWNSCSDVTVTA